jgi:simple sugar transport system permease protein
MFGVGALIALSRLNDNATVHVVVRAAAAVALAFAVTAVPILLSGKNPLVAYVSLLNGAFGTLGNVTFALNKSTPYMLVAIGVALCFRAQLINIGGEGQIAVGGIFATWVALNASSAPAILLVPASLLAAAAAGAAWSGIAAVIRLSRGVHEVLSTLLLNFIGVLFVAEALHGSMGEDGSGFPQSPLLENNALLPMLIPYTNLHMGFVIAVVAAIAAHVMLWRTRFGFRLRILGGSRSAAAYAGVPFARNVLIVMCLGGAFAGVAGGVEVLGVHFRLIEGFSTGFGFTAVAVALLAAANPIAVIPVGLFFGFLQAGALAMQRDVGVPSSLVFVIQGLSIVFVLCAMGLDKRKPRV